VKAKTSTSSPETRTRYGTANPEQVENALWEQAIDEEWTGYALRQHLGIDLDRNTFRQNFSHSAYREMLPGQPFWSWQRFGRTSTALPDGRVIHIAGEHEDGYDPDFCIYNDVMVQYAGGRREFFLYPKDVFPPTDFHTATLVGSKIVLIGSLSYGDLRRPGETQVLTLDIHSLRIERVATTGEGPGWLSDHIAERIGETRILVAGGEVLTADACAPNTGVFELDLSTMTWRRMEHGDEAVFPIPAAVYRAEKNPRYGTANPERSDNPFWHAMVRRQWPPSRARLHFGDAAPPEPELVLAKDVPIPEYGAPESQAWMMRRYEELDRSKLVRTIDDVVWTAVRHDALQVVLPDGRGLLIGGEVKDYGDEYADPWIYTDIIVTHADGAIEIVTYPRDVFAHAGNLVGLTRGADVFIFGTLDEKRHPESARQPMVLRLDTTSCRIERLSAPTPPRRLLIFPDWELREGNRVVLRVATRHDAPALAIAFDMETLSWSEPYPYPFPKSDE
jgi:hypothetical protein